MQVKDIPWERLTSWRSSQQKTHLSVRDRLLGQIVVDDQRVHAVIAEVFRHGAPGVRRQKLQRCRIRSRRRDNNRVLQRIFIAQSLHQLRNRGSLLANRDVHAIQLFLFVRAVVHARLVDDRINRNSRLSSLPIADDQFSLSSTNWHQRIHRF